MTTTVATNVGSGGAGILAEQPGGGTNPVIGISKLHTGALDVDGGPVTATNPLDIRIGDATHTVAVTAGTTAPGPNDQALVVSQSPNRSEQVGTTVALNALNAAAIVNASGFTAVGMLLAAGTLIGTIVAEISYDGGTSWDATLFDNPITGAKVASFTFASSNARTPASIVGNAGASLYRVRVSAFTSGTANCTLRANDIHDPSVLFSAPPTTATPSTAVSMGASDGTLLQLLRVSAKGTQAALALAVQNLKDSGRVYCNFATAAPVTGVTTEALITLTPYRDLVAGSTGTTFAVTAGKRLRIQQIIVTLRATSTVAVGGVVRLRLLAGTVVVTSPVHATLGCMSSDLSTAAAGNAQSVTINFPDGLELSGTMQLGLTQLLSATTATVELNVIGYEY